MDPFTMMMISKGVQQGAQAGSRLAQPKFRNSNYGRLISQRRSQGNLTPGQEMNALGRTATTATKQANLANKRYTGAMINQGIQGSVSAQRGLREAEADVRRTVADTGKGIYQDEERAKSQAKVDYAKLMDQDKAERRQAVGSLVGTGASILADYAGNQYSQQQAKDQSYMDAMNKYGKGNFSEIYSPETGKSIGHTGEGGALPADVKNEIEAYKQKAQYKSTLNTSDVENAISEFQKGGDGKMLFAKFLESGLSQADALILLEKYNEAQKQNSIDGRNLPGVGL
jgi:hypothetical protein